MSVEVQNYFCLNWDFWMLGLQDDNQLTILRHSERGYPRHIDLLTGDTLYLPAAGRFAVTGWNASIQTTYSANCLLQLQPLTFPHKPFGTEQQQDEYEHPLHINQVGVVFIFINHGLDTLVLPDQPCQFVYL